MEKQQSKQIRSRERRVAKARQFNLFSNEFMAVALNDIPACQHILRIITKQIRMI